MLSFFATFNPIAINIFLFIFIFFFYRKQPEAKPSTVNTEAPPKGITSNWEHTSRMGLRQISLSHAGLIRHFGDSASPK